MDVKTKVLESQRKIIDSLAGCELHIGLLYEKYASLFPAMNKSWLGLADAEKTHSNLLKTMHHILDKGSIFHNLGKFNDEVIQSMIDLLDESLKKVNDPNFTSSDAINTALKIESSIMDSHFYDVVSSDAPEFKIIAERLSSDTKKHVQAVRSHFHEQSPA